MSFAPLEGIGQVVTHMVVHPYHELVSSPLAEESQKLPSQFQQKMVQSGYPDTSSERRGGRNH